MMQNRYHDTEEPYGQPPQFTLSFEDQLKRSAFVRKVFLLMTSGLIVTAAFVVVSKNVEEVTMFIMKNLYLVWLALGVLIITQLLLTCIESCRRSFPVNIFLYYLMVLSMSYTLAVITLRYDLQVIYFSVIATFVLCLTIAVVSLFFGIDFTGYMGFYLIAGFVLIICSTIVLIVSIFYQSMLMQVIYSFIVVFIIGMYFGYELQMIFGGGRYEMDPDDYVIGAVVLYIDIIMLFIHLLRIIGYFRNN